MSPRRLATVAVLAAAVVALPGIAQASWSAVASGTASMGATTIRNAASINSACVIKPGPDNVTLTWPASPDSAIVSYVIDRTGGAGPFSIAAPKGSTTITDTSTTWAGATGNFTYSYTIRAVVGTAPWTTAVSTPTVRNMTKNMKCS